MPTLQADCSILAASSPLAMALPEPSSLVWSHATNSKAKLDAALSDPTITAIEADVMMGRYCMDDDSNIDLSSTVAIMSHPPHTHSDLSAEQFLTLILQDNRQQASGGRNRRRHVKLDFKEMEAVGPVLRSIAAHHSGNIIQNETTIFLNADILEGPGVRGPDALSVHPEEFLTTCLEHIDDMASSNKECSGQIRRLFAFSLGYKVNYASKEPYTKEDADAMAEIVTHYKLESKCGGVVLALNARTLAVDPAIFDGLFSRFKKLQILAWTGAGEVPIPQSSIDEIKTHYEKTGRAKRVGFDCDVA